MFIRCRNRRLQVIPDIYSILRSVSCESRTGKIHDYELLKILKNSITQHLIVKKK